MKEPPRKGSIANNRQIQSIEELTYQIEQLKSENAILNNIIYHIPGNVYWKDTDCRFLGGNKNMLDSANVKTIEEFVHTSNIQYIDPLNAARIDEFEREIMRTGEASHAEEYGPEKNGVTAIFHSQKLPLYNQKNEIIGLIGISIDITERKRMENDLRIAKEKAELASKAKTDFIANMSHDIKTPLAGIIGISELLSFRLTGSNLELAETLLMSGRQLLSFLENCFEVAKIDSDDILLEREYFHLHGTINEISELFSSSIKAKNLKLNVNMSQDLPEFLIGCRSALYRILLNLAANAVKFTEEGEINIHATIGRKVSEREVIIKLIIEDTGIGIASENHNIIFERFTKLAPSYKGTYSGSGIGLYLVQAFVKKMKGEVYLQSHLGTGSQFTIILPFEIPLLHSDEYKLLNKKNPTALENNLFDFFNYPTAHILLVEDNLVAQRVTAILLESLNCRVDIAEKGEKALFLFEQGKYDLVLLDIGLPDMQGDKVATLLRQKEYSSIYRTPIIALTAHTSNENSQNYKEQGIDEILSKPLLKNDAEKLIASILEKKQKTLLALS